MQPATKEFAQLAQKALYRLQDSLTQDDRDHHSALLITIDDFLHAAKKALPHEFDLKQKDNATCATSASPSSQTAAQSSKPSATKTTAATSPPRRSSKP